MSTLQNLMLSIFQMIKVTEDTVLIKQERLGANEHGAIFKGEKICTQSE